jgi:hypothetical protein
MKKMLKNMFFSIFGLCMYLQPVFSQQIVEVFGQLTTAQPSLNNAEIQIKRDNEGWLNVKFSKRNGEFNLALPLNHRYTFRFKQSGTIEKQIEFSTIVPEDYSAFEFDPFFFVVRLDNYSASPEIDTLFYNKPVGKIFFAEEFTKFDYDRDYSLSVREKLKETQVLVAQRQKAEMDALLAESLVVEKMDSDMVLVSDAAITIARASDSLSAEIMSVNVVEPVIAEVASVDEPVTVVEIDDPAALSDSILVAQQLQAVSIEPDSEKEIENTTAVVTVPEQKVTVEEVKPVRTEVNNQIEKPEANRQELVAEINKSTVADAKTPTAKLPATQESPQIADKQQSKPVSEPVPVSIGKPNGKEYAFNEDSDKQVTKIYLTDRGRTIIYAMFQYNNGRTLYFKQNAVTNDSIAISREIFTNALR